MMPPLGFGIEMVFMLFVIRSAANAHSFGFQRFQKHFFRKTGSGFLKEKQIGCPVNPSHFWRSLLLRQSGQLCDPIIQLAHLGRDEGVSLVKPSQLRAGQSRRERMNAELGAKSRALVPSIATVRRKLAR